MEHSGHPIVYRNLVLGAFVLVIVAGGFFLNRYVPLPVPEIETPKPFPIITEVFPNPSDAQTAWVEIRNPSDNDEAPLTGLRLHIPGADVIELDDASTELQKLKHIVICFDKVSEDTYLTGCPSSDGIVIHAPAAADDFWQPNRGQVALLRESSESPLRYQVVDFVAWGGPPEGDLPSSAAVPTVWRQRWVSLSISAGIIDSKWGLRENQAIALLPGGRPGSPRDWTLLLEGQATGGRPNTGGTPRFIVPPDGSTVRTEDATIVWLAQPSDTDYCVELRSAVGAHPFSPAVQRIDTQKPYVRPSELGIGDGTYTYRIRQGSCAARTGFWTDQRTITVASLDLASGVLVMAGKIEYAFQRKDTPLLCLTTSSDPTAWYRGCDREHWDRPHPPLVPPAPSTPTPPQTPSETSPIFTVAETWGKHGAMHCVRASVSMIASAYGGRLSQDRLSVEYQWDPTLSPDDDLEHDVGTDCGGTHGGAATGLLVWALGLGNYQSEVDVNQWQYPTLDYVDHELDFTTIEKHLSDNRPIMSRWDYWSEDHMRVIDGCFTADNGEKWIRVLDPFAGGPQWRKFRTPPTGCNFWETGCFQTRSWVCPVVGSNVKVRSDESTIWRDKDGDGITDFDEKRRFSTSRWRKDTDWDGVRDKAEISGYVFYPETCPTFPTQAASLPDFDGDGKRKERDWDNDGDGCPDGYEDSNRNGIKDDPDNSDCFRADDCGLSSDGCRDVESEG